MRGDRWRILLIVFNRVGRGTYWRAFHLGRVLAGRGHRVHLLAVSPTARLRWRERSIEGVQLAETPDLLPGSLRSGWDPWDTWRRMAWVRRRRFDVVHAFEARPVVLGPALAARRLGMPLVMDWCDWFGRGGSVEERANPVVRALLRPVETFLEDRFRTRAHGTTVINTFLRDRAVALGVPEQTILLLRNGSDPRVPRLERTAARRRIGVDPDAPLIGYAGAAFARDAELMAAAFNHVRRARPDAKLMLIGYFNRDIETLVDAPGAVARSGIVTAERMHECLSACDVCWLPLLDSGANRGRLPMKLNDYLTAGRPVVVSDVGDLGQVVTAHGVGVVSPPEPAPFAAKTVALLSDAARCVALGHAARGAAEGPLSWDRVVDDLEGFYRRVLDSTLPP